MPVFAALLLTAALGAVVAFTVLYQPPYKPPPFEPSAEVGRPEPPKNFGYSEIDAMGNFKFGIAKFKPCCKGQCSAMGCM